MTSRSPLTCAVAGAESKSVKGWRDTKARDHFVQFYRTDDYLVECLAGYVAEGIWKNERVLIIATPAHRMALEERLREKGIDLVSSIVRGIYLALDAREVLSRFMVSGRPDRDAFLRFVGGLVTHATADGAAVRAFGEMVALLWAEGNRRAAIELENLWNELGREHAFALYCAYPAELGESAADEPSLEHICRSHSCVISLA